MKKILCMVLALCLMFSMAACGKNAGNVTGRNMAELTDGYKLSSLSLPRTVSYPDSEDYKRGNGTYDYNAYERAFSNWTDLLRDRMGRISGYNGKLSLYLKNASAFLFGEDGKNKVCSPLNIYFALAMLAECAGGETRAEIMNVLGFDDINDLRKVSKTLWEQYYFDSDNLTTLLGSSIWMNQEIDGVKLELNKDTLATLAKYYYAESFSGMAADNDFSTAFKAWLDEHTGGLLHDQAYALKDFEEDLIMAIATTVYYKGSWDIKFNKDHTADDTFHAVDGDKSVPFMHSEQECYCIKDDGLTAVGIDFQGVGRMWFILPDEGISPEQLNESGALAAFLEEAAKIDNGTMDAEGLTQAIGKLSIPKFDVDSTIDLIPALKSLGVNQAFDQYKGDFSNLTELQAYVSKATHSARVKIDEEGCEAAAFTVITLYAGAALIPGQIEFKADRPFAFAITGIDGLPLFTGIVDQP